MSSYKIDGTSFEIISWLFAMHLLTYWNMPARLYAILLTMHTGTLMGRYMHDSHFMYNRGFLWKLIGCYSATILTLFLNTTITVEIFSIFSLLSFFHFIFEKYDLYLRYSKECIFENIFLFFLLKNRNYTILPSEYLIFDISFLLLELFYKDKMYVGDFSRIYYIILFHNLKNLLF